MSAKAASFLRRQIISKGHTRGPDSAVCCHILQLCNSGNHVKADRVTVSVTHPGCRLPSCLLSAARWKCKTAICTSLESRVPAHRQTMSYVTEIEKDDTKRPFEKKGKKERKRERRIDVVCLVLGELSVNWQRVLCVNNAQHVHLLNCLHPRCSLLASTHESSGYRPSM